MTGHNRGAHAKRPSNWRDKRKRWADRLSGGTRPGPGHAGRSQMATRRLGALMASFIVAMLFACTVLTASRPARAQGPAQDFTTTEKAADFLTMAFIEAQDGSTVYCLDIEKLEPKPGEWLPYQPVGDVDNDLAYVALNGWPRTTTIAGRSLTDREARAATQIATWMLRGSVGDDGSFYGGNFANSQNGEEVVAAARGLVAAARADNTDFSGSGITIYSPDPSTPNTDAYQTLMYVPALGTIALDKDSANSQVSAGNNLYKMAGLSYGVFDSEQAATNSKGDPGAARAYTITLDEQGRGTATGVENGTWWVRELDDAARRASGYALDESVYRVDVRVGSTVEDPDWVHTQDGSNPADAPLLAPVGMVVMKVDAQTGEATAQGAASLAGAEFTLDYYAGSYGSVEELPSSPARSWVVRTDEDGTALLDEEHLVSGDEPYRAPDGSLAIPLGTVAIRETKAPQGYLATDEVRIVPVCADAESGTVAAFDAARIGDRVIRGDVRFNKASFPDQQRMGSVPFLVTSLTTGERHVIVTDENGSFDSSAAWVPHTTMTNANDALLDGDGTGITDDTALTAQAGIWFSGAKEALAEADDSCGAMPFDAYTFQELRCQANDGLQLVRFTVSISRDGVNLDMGTVLDNAPAIATSLADAAGSKDVDARQGVKLLDEVHYSGVIAHETYQLELTIYDAQAQELVRDGEGTPVRLVHEFAPQGTSGTEHVAATLDTRELGGRRLVAFERLYDATGTLIASHVDESSQSQSVTVREQEPPQTTQEPEDPGQETPESPREEDAPGEVLPQTGVEGVSMALAMAGALAAAAGIASIVRSHRRGGHRHLGGVGRHRR